MYKTLIKNTTHKIILHKLKQEITCQNKSILDKNSTKVAWILFVLVLYCLAQGLYFSVTDTHSKTPLETTNFSLAKDVIGYNSLVYVNFIKSLPSGFKKTYRKGYCCLILFVQHLSQISHCQILEDGWSGLNSSKEARGHF